MNCIEVTNLLSAFLDGELTGSRLTEVTRHLEACADCRRLQESYLRLGQLSRDALPAAPIGDLWPSIATGLAQDEVSRPVPASRRAWLGRWTIWAQVAAVLVLLGIGMLAWNRPLSHAEKQLADVFDRYLIAFSTSPVEAQEILDKAYPSTLVSIGQSHPLADEAVMVRRGDLPGLRRVSVVVRNLPCCDCVQGLFQRPDGSYLTVFEHEMPSQWDTNQPCTMVNCANCKCRLMQIDSRFAASWTHDSRYFTVIGAHDLDEVESLVRLLDPALPSEPAPASPQGES